MLNIADLLQASHANGANQNQIVQDALHAIRTHLGMDVAFLAEFQDQTRIFKNIDSSMELPIRPGDATPLEETYCQRVVDGRLPGLIPDTSLVPEAASLAVTKQFGIGAYLTAPIRMADGNIYGTLCCLSFAPDASLGQRDIAMLNLFGDFMGKQLERSVAAQRSFEDMAGPVRQMLATNNFSIHYQPIYSLNSDEVVGFEALTRFSTTPYRSPDMWFGDAAKVGLSMELEMAALTMAACGLDRFPKNTYLSLNVSPANILNGATERVLPLKQLDRIVLEITEHDSVEDYDALAMALAPLRERGLRLAVDDAGAGYASFRHILKLEPDLIKLDISITRDIDTQLSRRALASALIRFAEETGCQVIAEGVETPGELQMLRHLRVDKVQGYLIGKPSPIDVAVEMCTHIRKQ